MNKKYFVGITVFVAACVLLFMGMIVFFGGRHTVQKELPQATLQADGTQLLNIQVKEGYTPKEIQAKAGVATILRFVTEGTFDCSASIVLPKIGIQKFLPQTGTTDIALTTAQAQGTLLGTCGMGMYSFRVRFE